MTMKQLCLTLAALVRQHGAEMTVYQLVRQRRAR
jgi:hypothetical protein